MTLQTKWTKRLYRLGRRLSIAGADVDRAFQWYFAGGRRHFNRFSTEMISAHKWCFVVGCNNSGTSLLQSMLESTSQISTFQSEGQFYTRTLRRAERRGYERVWTEYVNDLAMSADDSLECVPRLVHDWLISMPSPARKVIVEKTPANVVRMEWLQNAFPNSYFIGLVRNGYAVSEGIRRKGDKSILRAARHWNDVNSVMLNRSKNVDRFTQVRYEHLVDRHDEVMLDLVRFLDIDKPIQVQLKARPASIREDHRSLRNFNSESISRLTEDDRRVVYENAREMLDHFDYSPGPD